MKITKEKIIGVFKNSWYEAILLWKWVLVSAGIFIVSLLIGMQFATINLEEIQQMIVQVGGRMSSIEGFGEINYTLMEGIAYIFVNNMITAIFAVLFGPLLGMFPIVIPLVNGFFVGIIAVLLEAHGMSYTQFFVAGIFPHGIIELPGVFIATGLGMKMGWDVLIPPKGINRRTITELNYQIGKKLFPLVALLLFVAAIIEMALTPYIISSF